MCCSGTDNVLDSLSEMEHIVAASVGKDIGANHLVTKVYPVGIQHLDRRLPSLRLYTVTVKLRWNPPTEVTD